MAKTKAVSAKAGMKAEKVLKTKKAAPAAKKTTAAAREAKGLPPIRAKKAPAKKAVAAPAPAPTPEPAAAPARETKKAVAIQMLTEGATVAALMERLGWLRHTTRSFISVLGRTRKIGFAKAENGERTYTLAK